VVVDVANLRKWFGLAEAVRGIDLTSE